MDQQNLERLDWNNLSDDDLSELESRLKAELSQKEQSSIDMIMWGKLLLFKAKSVSLKVNNEILSVCAEWIDDPDMLLRHRIEDQRVYDWAALKRDQRRYDRALQAERLRLYWQKYNQKKELLKLLGQETTSTPLGTNGTQHYSTEFMTEFLSTFSPEAETERDLQAEFDRLLDISEVHRLPLKALILSEVSRSPKFILRALPTYTSSPKLELVAKLSTLLSMETQGLIELVQEDHFDDITINTDTDQDLPVTVKDREGQTKQVNISTLNEADKTSFIEQAKNGEIICI
ncbi:hypothetical protein D1BOALGB6SA_5963 [Olavius sp. associated proteobacterium Delta 1]|nr:hypothetical protein D1BOALGB6SA_5963 [Olavius sp. associated proteobacterium Delta 1]